MPEMWLQRMHHLTAAITSGMGTGHKLCSTGPCQGLNPASGGALYCPHTSCNAGSVFEVHNRMLSLCRPVPVEGCKASAHIAIHSGQLQTCRGDAADDANAISMSQHDVMISAFQTVFCVEHSPASQQD